MAWNPQVQPDERVVVDVNPRAARGGALRAAGERLAGRVLSQEARPRDLRTLGRPCVWIALTSRARP